MSLTGAVDARATTRAIPQLLIAPAHGASSVVKMILQAVATADTAQRGFPIGRRRFQKLVPEAMPPGVVAVLCRIFPDAGPKKARSPGSFLDEIAVDQL